MDQYIRHRLRSGRRFGPGFWVEALNGILYVLVFWRYGPGWDCVFYCLLFSALAVLGIIDFKTRTIPLEVNIFLLLLGLAHMLVNLPDWRFYGAGFLSAIPLLLIYLITRGRGIGGGDVKLMAATGLLLGSERNLLGLFLGCILGLAIQLCGKSRRGTPLALGPWLSLGIMLAVMAG